MANVLMPARQEFWRAAAAVTVTLVVWGMIRLVFPSVSLDWTYYDLDKGNPAVDKLVDQYLHRDYSLPLEGYVGAKFDLLKCLDMYHSKELDEQVRKYVDHPDWIGSKPPKRKRK